MNLLLKNISSVFSSPMPVAPNALAFSSASGAEIALSTSSSLSNPKTRPSSPLSSMTPASTPKTKKRKRYRGWVCEDEISDGDSALFEKLEANGRESSAAPLTSSTLRNAETAALPAELESSSIVCNIRFNLRQPKTAGSESKHISPSKNQGLSIDPIERKTTTKYNRKSQKRVLIKTKEKPRIAPKPPRLRADMPHASKNGDEQQPKKKPRFRGYVCEDEAEENDPALANIIREKGTLFQLKEAAPVKNSSARELGKGQEDLQDKSNQTKSQPFNSFEASSSQNRSLTAESPEKLKAIKRQPRNPKLRSAPPKQRSKRRQKRYTTQHRTPITKASPLFPNLYKNSRITPSATPSSIPTVPNKDSSAATPLARAQRFVTTSTSEFKHLTALADQAAKAAAVAKRKAGDAANKLEEAKRTLRVETEKEKAKNEGRRFVRGYAWIDSEEDEQGWDKARSRRKRGGDEDVAEIGGRLGFGQADKEERASQIGMVTGLEDSDNEHDNEELEEDDEDDEDDEEEGEDEDDEDDEEEGDDDDDEEEDEEEDEEDEDEDEEKGEEDNYQNGRISKDDGNVHSEFDSSDDEDGFPIGRTADLLG